MRITHVLMAVALTALGLIVGLTDVRLFPDVAVGAAPLVLFAVLISLGGVSQMKEPAGLRMAVACGLWGAVAGFRIGTLGFVLCGVAIGLIGFAVGVEVERYKISG